MFLEDMKKFSKVVLYPKGTNLEQYFYGSGDVIGEA